MNEMNHLEEQLRSWKPRRPSSEIKPRLFGKTASEPRLFDWAVLRRLVPAAGCAALALLFLQAAPRHTRVAPSSGGAVPLFAAIGSNATVHLLVGNDLFLASAGQNVQWNVWDTATFHWTNEHLWTSSMGSFQLAKTNHLQ